MQKAGVLFLMYLGCCFLGLPSVAVAENKRVEEVIESLNSTWNEAFNSKNASAVAALYDKRAILSPGNGETVTGRAEIERLFQSFIDDGLHNHSIEIIDVHGQGSLVYEVARWSASGPQSDGKQSTFGGILINVFQQGADGEWQSLSHVWNASAE
jgi:uncharacterized protein (TIGR02246 family)